MRSVEYETDRAGTERDRPGNRSTSIPFFFICALQERAGAMRGSMYIRSGRSHVLHQIDRDGAGSVGLAIAIRIFPYT